jgi:transposase, IS5 family
LAAQVAQCNAPTARAAKPVKEAVVDLGYWGVDGDKPNIRIVHRGRIKSMGQRQREQVKRRQAIEPVIGHVKDSTGDALHAIARAAGYNVRWLLRATQRLGLQGLFALIALIVLCRAPPGSMTHICVNRAGLSCSRDTKAAEAAPTLGEITRLSRI